MIVDKRVPVFCAMSHSLPWQLLPSSVQLHVKRGTGMSRERAVLRVQRLPVLCLPCWLPGLGEEALSRYLAFVQKAFT